MRCPNCQTENPDESKFCRECGQSLLVKCSNCGHENLPGSKFCNNCGQALAVVAGPEPPTRQEPAATEPTRSQGRPSLDPYLPPEFAARLDEARRSGAMEGERRVVTMLFCDLKGSTAAARRLDPEEWAEIMNGAFEHMISPIYRYEGIVARLMGDAVLAFFGAPIAHEDDPRRAVLAGLGIQEGIADYAAEMKRQWGVDLKVRVGINTGLVVVGGVGSDLRMEYTAMGDAINLAARMEQTAEPGTIQITEETFRQVAPFFEFEEVEALAVKGVEHPMVAYRVLGHKSTPGRLRGIEGLEAPLVGRTGEWERLLEASGNLERGIGGLVCLLGEGGLGKSRLVQELHTHIENSPLDFEWHETASLSYEMDRPYALFQRLVRRMVGASESDSRSHLREKLEAIVGEVLGEEAATVRPVFASLFGLPAEAGQPPLEGEAFRGRLFTVMERLWDQRASQRPTVLVFDDLHWSDPASVDLLIHLLPLTERAPLLLLWAMRPERKTAGWQVRQVAETDFGYRYTEIALQPLSQSESGELVDGLVTISDLPPRLRAHILEKSEGNPFFVEEVVRSLIDAGALVPDETGQHWQATGNGQDIEIPGNVQALLAARIDRLDAEVRHTLQLASVIGRSFYYRVLARIVEMAEALNRQLLTLERAELIREATRLPELQYLFRHALTQEAAYSTILLKQRRIYHRQVGEALEALFPEQKAELASNLAGHFQAARDYKRALDYYTIAGDVAFRLHATVEAIEHYGQAITCAGKVGADSDRLVHLYTRRGRSYELSSRFDEALETYREMRRLAEELGDRALELSSLAAECIIRATQSGVHDPILGREQANRALALAQELGDRAAEAKVLWGLLILETWSGGDIRQGLYHGERSLAIARDLKLTEQMGFTLTNLASANFALNRLEAATQAVLEARAIWLELGNAPMLADSYGLASVFKWSTADYDGTIADSNERIRIGKSIGNDWNYSAGLFMLALANYERGEFGRSIEYLDQGLQIAEKAGLSTNSAFYRSIQISTYTALGALRQAQTVAEHMIAAQDNVVIFVRSMAAAAISQLQIRQGEPGQAQRILAEGLEIADFESMAYCWATPPHVAQIHLLLATDEPGLALEKADLVAGYLRPTGVRLNLAETLWLKGKALIALGNLEQAREALSKGQAIAEETSGRRIMWQILATLTEVEDGLGNAAAAGALRQRAKEVIEYIAVNVGSEELRASFLAQAEVSALLAADG